jgi:hypothetical protein
VEELGAGGGTERVEALADLRLELIGVSRNGCLGRGGFKMTVILSPVDHAARWRKITFLSEMSSSTLKARTFREVNTYAS